MLGALVIALILVLASPVKRYLGSRSDLHSAARQLQHDRDTLAGLRAQQKRWSDPTYVEQQARRRLQYAMPGDTVYTVVDKGQRSDIERTRGTTKSTPPDTTAWNKRLWGSVRVAAG